jgi:hypothetical protein
LMDNSNYRGREIIFTPETRSVAERDSVQYKKGEKHVDKTFIRPYTLLHWEVYMVERGNTPPHFARLRRGWVSGAVEAKCGGCERACCSGGDGMEEGKEQQA